MPLTLPSTFRWGPRLRTLHLTRIAIPALLQLLSSSRNLVDLQLHEVLNLGISPRGPTNALSGMTQLRSLSLHFLLSPLTFTLPTVTLLGDRIVLPALTRLNFEALASTWKALYSESMLLVSRISKSHSPMNLLVRLPSLANSSIG